MYCLPHNSWHQREVQDFCTSGLLPHGSLLCLEIQSTFNKLFNNCVKKAKYLLGKAEVTKLEAPLAVNQQIVWFQIPSIMLYALTKSYDNYFSTCGESSAGVGIPDQGVFEVCMI